MQTYTVIWRDSGDDFMFTEVQTIDEPHDLPSVYWVHRAAEVEYAQWDEADRIQAIAELLTSGYDLLDVVKGRLESVL